MSEKHTTSKLLATRNLIKPSEWHIEQSVERIHEAGEGTVSVACLDIDHFTEVEVERGYEAADALLNVLHWHLVKEAESNPQINRASRYVRDSFLVIMDGQGMEEAFLAIEGLRASLSMQEWKVKGPFGTMVPIRVTFSAGVATYPGHPEDSAQLIGLAEDAALRALQKGGATTLFARPEKMEMKANYYFPSQLVRLKSAAIRLGRTEAAVLREALDDLLRKYDQREIRRRHVYKDGE